MLDCRGGEAAGLTGTLVQIPEQGRAPLVADRPPGASGCPVCGSPGTPTDSAAGRATLPESIVAALLLARSLTPREMATLELLGHGHDNRTMARMLSISERTVKRHITAILAKLGLESRLQAGLVAMIMNPVSLR